MRNLRKTRFCLGIQVEHLSSGIFFYQSNYTEKVLDRFYMDKTHPLTTPMVVRSLEVEKNPFHPRKQDEEAIGPEFSYLCAIWSPYIAVIANLLARFNFGSTKRCCIHVTYSSWAITNRVTGNS